MENPGKVAIETFLDGQKSVYEKFKSNVHLVRKKGISPSGVVQDRKRGGYAINLRHPEYITNPLKEFSLAVAATVPSIVFDETNAHTSLVVYKTDSNFTPDERVIQTLEEGVHASWNQLRRPEVSYLGWLYNQDSVIAEGYADSVFVFAMNILLEFISQRGIQDIGKRKAWGGYITANRFIEPRSPESLIDFFRLMDNPHSRLGQSKPTFLDVGYFEIHDCAGNLKNPADGFRYIVTKRFEF